MRIISIDIGTSHSCVCVSEGDLSPKVVSIDNQPLFPSYVNFKDMNNIITGTRAYNHRDLLAGNVVTCNKLFFGRRYDSKMTEQLRELCFAKIVEDDKHLCAFSIPQGNKQITISSQRVVEELLKRLYNAGKKELRNQVPDEVWITIPVTYGQIQKGIMRRAISSVITDCRSVQFITEPSAAAIAYGLRQEDNRLKDGYYLFYDLGGGTFDVSIIEIRGTNYTILGCSGHSTIGGSKFDNMLMNYVLEEYKNIVVAKNRDEAETILLPEEDDQLYYLISKDALLRECKKVKEGLSQPGRISADININEYMKAVQGHYEIIDDENVIDTFESVTINRSTFESLIKNDIESTIQITQQLLDDHKLTTWDIERVLLIGGSTYIPHVRDRLKQFFGEDKIGMDINPSTCVAFGAALRGRFKEINSVNLTECSTYNIELKTAMGYAVLIRAGTKLPHENEREFTIVRDTRLVSAPVYENIDGERVFICNCILERKKDDEANEDLKVRVRYTISNTGELSISYIGADGHTMQQVNLVI